MASIERTAYPRFTPSPSSKDLLTLYTPTEEEVVRTTGHTLRNHQLTCLVLLKTFQRLGYFPRLSEVPETIVQHLRSVLHCGEDVAVGFPEPRTLYRHHRLIREYLGVTAYGTASATRRRACGLRCRADDGQSGGLDQCCPGDLD